MFNLSKLLGGLTPEIGRMLSGMLQGSDQRQAFTALLLATVTNVQKKPNFNLELEINDLLVHLDALRSQQGAGGLGAAMQQAMGNLNMNMTILDGMLRTMNDMQQNMIRNIR